MTAPFGSIKCDSRGLALIEALVVLVILGLSALSFSGVQSLLWLNGETGKQREQALQVALQDLEGTRAQALAAYDQVASTAELDIKADATGTVYSLRRTVFAGEHAPYKTVNVEVRWSDRAGRQQSVVLSTAVSKPTPRAS